MRSSAYSLLRVSDVTDSPVNAPTATFCSDMYARPPLDVYHDAPADVVAPSRLSFYKESLAGETDNFIHLRAVAEQKDPLITLREVVEETLDSVRKVEVLTAADPQLAYICRSYVMVSVSIPSQHGHHALTIDACRDTPSSTSGRVRDTIWRIWERGVEYSGVSPLVNLSALLYLYAERPIVPIDAKLLAFRMPNCLASRHIEHPHDPGPPYNLLTSRITYTHHCQHSPA